MAKSLKQAGILGPVIAMPWVFLTFSWIRQGRLRTASFSQARLVTLVCAAIVLVACQETARENLDATQKHGDLKLFLDFGFKEPFLYPSILNFDFPAFSLRFCFWKPRRHHGGFCGNRPRMGSFIRKPNLPILCIKAANLSSHSQNS